MADKNYLRPRALIISTCAALLFVLAFAAVSSFPALRGQATSTAKERVDERRAAAANPSTPFTVYNSSSALELDRSIDREIDESEFARARWGVFVMSLRDGRVLYARDADRTFAPASNMKVYTTSVALDSLGADYRWRTSVYAEAGPGRDGTIEGDLTLYGRGAPDLSSNTERDESKSSLAQLADELYKRGIRHVRGDVVGDESYFKGDPLGDGWLWNDVQWYFGAEISALSINDNEIKVAVTPSIKPDETASIKLKPETAYVQIKNDTNTATRGTPATIGVTRGLSDNQVRVWGDFPLGGQVINARLSVHQPALWAATLFREALRARGITVEGVARSVDARDSKTGTRIDPEHAVELASLTSKTLREIIRSTNKESINLYAELILRTLGKERGGSAPDKDAKKMRTRGDDEAGVAVIRQWLEKHGISTDALALHDGSGLSRLDLVTPEATTRLLALMTQTSSAGDFRDSLPVAGRDGTLKFRLRSVGSDRIAAKTGTLTYINSLSGYATTDDDEPLAFSIICNDETTPKPSTKVIDAIALLLTSYSESGR
ncbi:MAG TPA: D-alanyl-D-alanine carboxypeptidase/D-alanyl-D-alanine-endopeptidase [Pyrinomonadaceae bacterium]|nr:D-alanyl-D-alanine carboxypeptidase/D-alanyl-D-alanine-endopeptidase [Pyrinomonadaceae bacterium]